MVALVSPNSRHLSTRDRKELSGPPLDPVIPACFTPDRAAGIARSVYASRQRMARLHAVQHDLRYLLWRTDSTHRGLLRLRLDLHEPLSRGHYRSEFALLLSQSGAPRSARSRKVSL